MIRYAFLLVSALAVGACGDLRDLLTLEQALAKEFPNQPISVNINNNTQLTVTFANSPAAQLPDSEQAAFARHVAEVVRDNYSGYAHLEGISVGFSTVRGAAGFSITTTRVPYHFTPAQLGPPAERKAAKPKAAV